jgi:hypothetical protein
MRLLRYCIHKPSTNALRASIVGLQPSPTLTTNPGIASGSAVIRSALEEVLRKAKKMGEAKPSLDERAVAYFLQSTMVGMRVTAKVGASSEVLRAIALTALEVLAV